MNVAIVGLGLIGGSMAKSIKNRTSHTVWGIDLNAETMTMARMCGAIDAPLTEENLPQADLILVAIRPGAAIEWVRQQRLRQHSLSGCGHLLCHKGYRCSPSAAQRRGRLQHARHTAVFIIAQRSAITNKKQGLFAIFYKFCKISHSPGIVLQQAPVGGKLECGAVHLCAAGIQCAQHGALAGVCCGQCFQRRHRCAQRLPREGKALDRCQTDAQAGKAARAGVDAVQVDVRTGHAAHLQAGVDHGHQGLAVGHARIQIDLVQQAVVLQKSHTGCLARRIHG